MIGDITPILRPKRSQGRLPNDVRTQLMGLEAKETELLAGWLLNKKANQIESINLPK